MRFMKFASIRLVTRDVDRLVAFYAMLTGTPGTRLADDFAEVRLDGAVLAIASERSIVQFNVGAATAAANRSAIVELQVDDVDAVQARLTQQRQQHAEPIDWVMAPVNQPWGNRSMLLRDPDGNLINVFARGPAAKRPPR
jgi:catechol 2,3-dioxygenase-like lactoylglutathione lyase family enzyme